MVSTLALNCSDFNTQQPDYSTRSSRVCDRQQGGDVGQGDDEHWLSIAGSLHLKLQRACLPSEGAAVTAFLAARSTNWAEMKSPDQVALSKWLDRGLARKSEEWEPSVATVAIMARNRFGDWQTPNIWDRPEMSLWREQRSVVEVADLVDLFLELEAAWEVASHG